MKTILATIPILLGLTDESAPTQRELEHNTFITHSDMDGGPTKAFLVHNRNHPTYSTYYHRAFDKRPRVMGDGTRFDKMPYTFNRWSASVGNN